MKITVGGSLSTSEVQYGTAVVKHENHSDEEKQAHQDVENAVSLATRVFNFVHIVLQNFVVLKCGAKVEKPGTDSACSAFFFTISERF
ncbi:MAG: hypothetical protein IT261_10710 [Saprospiraceae bacterium]|nr:hypothetical protein [Saprospiraceae bacterium]